MPIKFQVTIRPDIAPLLARFANSSELISMAGGALRKSTRQLHTELTDATPHGKGTTEKGHRRLAEAWQITDRGLEFLIANTEGQKLHWVVKGNDPGGGWIYPTHSRFLRFEIDGDVIFARRVRASKPNDFVTPILTRWRVEATSVMQATVATYGRWLLKG